jgi:hypothetical protein
MTSQTTAVTMAAAAQAAYALFGDLRNPLPALIVTDKGAFTNQEASRFAGELAPSDGPFLGRYLVPAHTPNTSNGFSATVIDPGNGGTKILAIRGTEDAVDLLQDAVLAAVGLPTDQVISMYRFYRQLTTPAGEQVQYTAADIDLLHKLNLVSSPIRVLLLGANSTNDALDAALALDRGLQPFGDGTGSVLLPGEPLIVTGHSLGAHLALLFGRLFPEVTRDIYAFNTPGISLPGEVALGLMGIGPNAPSHVFNFIADHGLDMVSALGLKPGALDRIFIEGSTSPLANHSIIPLTDSLALYDLIAALSPGLDGRTSQITSIIAGASRSPIDSLERTLDLLRGIVNADGTTTPVATDRFDQPNRDVYYTRLYMGFATVMRTMIGKSSRLRAIRSSTWRTRR